MYYIEKTEDSNRNKYFRKEILFCNNQSTIRILFLSLILVLFFTTTNATLPNKFRNDKVLIHAQEFNRIISNNGNAGVVANIPTGNDNEEWQILETDESNWYRIKHVHSGLYITIDIVPPSLFVQLGAFIANQNQSDRQKFKFVGQIASDEFKIHSKFSTPSAVNYVLQLPAGNSSVPLTVKNEPNTIGPDIHQRFKLTLIPFGEKVSFNAGITATKTKLMSKSWYIHDKLHESLLAGAANGVSDPDDLGQLRILDYGVNSQFIVEETENALWFLIRHRASQKYVTANGSSPGSSVSLELLLNNGEDESQHFRRIQTGEVNWHKIRSRLGTTAQQLNLEVLNTGKAIVNSPKIDPSPEQKFAFNTTLPNNTTERYAIVGKNNGHFVSNEGLKSTNAPVRHIEASNHSVIWNFHKLSNGYFRIFNTLTGGYIANLGQINNGTELFMTYNPGAGAEWELIRDGQYFQLKNHLSGFYLSTFAKGDNENPVYQANTLVSSTSWLILPVLSNDPYFDPSTFNTLQDIVPFPPLTPIPVVRKLLPSIGLPDNPLLKSVVWKALVHYYGSTILAENALAVFNSGDPGHRAEMAVVLREYVLTEMVDKPKNTWCPDELLLAQILEAKINTIRIDYAERKIAAWNEFQNNYAVNSGMLALLYNGDADNFELPATYILSDGGVLTDLENYARFNTTFGKNNPIETGLYSVTIAVPGILGALGAMGNGITSGTITLLNGVEVAAPVLRFLFPARFVQYGGYSLGAAVSSAAGIVTIVTTAVQILALHAIDVFDNIEFDERLQEDLLRALAGVDMWAVMNGHNMLDQIKLFSDLDFLIGGGHHDPSNGIPVNDYVHISDGLSFIPQINCPANDSVFASVETCTFAAQILINEPNNCEAGLEPYFTTNIQNNQALPIGNTVVNYVTLGGRTLCSYTITVLDNHGPIIIDAPLDITLNNSSEDCSPSVTWIEPTFTDCQAFNVISSIDPGASFDPGINTVAYQAFDVDGNLTVFNFNVTVNNTVAPTAMCKSDFTVPLDIYGNSDLIFASDIDNGSFDACAGNVTLSLTQPFGEDLDCDEMLKSFTLTVTNEDGLESVCTTTVSAIDTIAPSVSCLNKTIYLDINGQANISPEEINTGSYDACGISSINLNSSSFDCSTIGVNQVELSVEDNHGNVNICTALITVLDTISPTLASQFTDLIFCGAQQVYWPIPSISDNCSQIDIVTSHANGSYFEVGVTTVSYEFIDAGGNSVMTEFTVTINELPDVVIVTQPVPEFCQGLTKLFADVINSTNLLGELDYSWGGNLIETEALITIDANDEYHVTVTDENNCIGSASIVTNLVPSDQLSAYTLIAKKDLTLNGSSVSKGGAGVINSNKEAKLKNGALVNDFVKAPIINLNSGGMVLNQIIGTVDVDLPFFKLNQDSGNNHIIVGTGSTFVLTDASYGNIIVKKDATLIFNNPEIYIKSLLTRSNATIKFLQSTEVIVDKNIQIGQNNLINPSDEDVLFYVEKDLIVGGGTEFTANAYVKKGLTAKKADTNNNTLMKGLFISLNNVVSREFVNWSFSGICDPNNQSTQARQGSDKETNLLNESYFNRAYQTRLGSDNGLPELLVYPNPTSDFIHVSMGPVDVEAAEIELRDVLGNLVYSATGAYMPNNTVVIDVSTYATGVYYLSIRLKNETSMTKKIIITSK